ncbi:N-6 DNA methylase [Streptomyces sp. NBC_00102]|uniref:N-6 DNA methylase n=1 Tax=Streptomyces sp. NBC_00102 TaxID=2975652 RepID=UPI00224ECAA1|nr:N-6 DNA methylase [Streptomyces sp. NBC_00102]MCX5399153.1 N-6 DNA methylase [Streptomyces sp. NBC_00102]
MPENASEVTAAGIARLAGVGRAAVSNWRRRHADFPKPVGGTETSPSFVLAEVEEWLRGQGKLVEVPLRERVWQQLAGHPAGPVAALIHVGCALLLVRDRPTVWLELAEVSDERVARLLPEALAPVLDSRFGPEASDGQGQGQGGGPEGLAPAAAPAAVSAVGVPGAEELRPSVPLLRGAAALAAESGAGQAFEFLFGRQLDANPRQYTLTPPELATLMADLALRGEGPGRGPSGKVPAPVVLDPASGTGALLRAVGRPAVLYAQESDPDLAALTALRLALGTGGGAAGGAAPEAPGLSVRAGDTLRADAFPKLAADVVLCHPPFNERNWGHDELAYDPRWEYGYPARAESELAWVQHALARLRPGGTAVLLMPPAAVSRRSGRRIRADLLRRGALRAVVALPAGAAPPYGIPLHLWILRKPDHGVQPSPGLLLVDTAESPDPAVGAAAGAGSLAGSGRERIDWPLVRRTVLDAWGAFTAADPFTTADRGPGTDPFTTADRGPGTDPFTATDRGPATPQDTAPVTGASRVVPVVDLLDDDVDLTPGRHLPRPATAGGVAELAAVRDRLTDELRLTLRLTPPSADPVEPASRPFTTLGELARAGALRLSTGGSGGGRGPVLTEHDVLGNTPPSGAPTGPAEDPVVLRTGDVVVPVLGGGSVVRVVDEATAGAVLGRNLQLLRPDPSVLDPWFLAGFLRGTANTRRASSHASTASRLDARRIRLPRLPLDEQRRYGVQFRALAAFEDALRTAGRLGGLLVQGMYDGLTDGTVSPPVS